MNFSDMYKEGMDQVSVSQEAIDRMKISLSMDEELIIKSKRKNLNFHKRNIILAALLLLSIITIYNFNSFRVFATSVLKPYIIDLGWKRAELGELNPIKLDMDSFLKSSGVRTYNFDDGTSYDKIYPSYKELKRETGIFMISSELLKPGSTVVLIIFPKYSFGKLNGEFYYKDYYINIDSVFALEGDRKGSIGYGDGDEEHYDFSYQAANGITAYFIKSKNYGSKVFFRAGDIIYQVVSDCGVKDMKKIIDSFTF